MMIIKYFFEKQGLQDIKYVLLPFIFAIWLNFIKMEIFSISILWWLWHALNARPRLESSLESTTQHPPSVVMKLDVEGR